MIKLKEQTKEGILLSTLKPGTLFVVNNQIGIKVDIKDYEHIKAISITGDDYWDIGNFYVDEVITDITELEII